MQAASQNPLGWGHMACHVAGHVQHTIYRIAVPGPVTLEPATWQNVSSTSLPWQDMSSADLPTKLAGHQSSQDLLVPVITLQQFLLPEWSRGYSTLVSTNLKLALCTFPLSAVVVTF